MKKLLRYLLILIVILVTLPLAVVFFRPSLIVAKDKVTSDFTTPNSHFMNWRGATIHYTDEGSGKPLLMIHGFGGHYRNFNKLAEEFKGEYRVIRVDLPGFGLSDCPPVDENHPQYVKLYRDFFTFFLDSLHLDSMYVVGNSMGGMMAWNIAALDPSRVSKLVLLGSAGYDLEKTANGLIIIRYKALSKIFDKGLPLFMSKSGAERCYGDPSKVDMTEVQNNNEITNKEGNLQHMLSMARDKDFPDTALIKQVKCPTLIIWGKQDHIVPLEHAYRFKRDIPNSELVLFDTCGHVPMIEKTKETSAEMRRFFAEPVQ